MSVSSRYPDNNGNEDNSPQDAFCTNGSSPPLVRLKVHDPWNPPFTIYVNPLDVSRLVENSEGGTNLLLRSRTSETDPLFYSIDAPIDKVAARFNGVTR